MMPGGMDSTATTRRRRRTPEEGLVELVDAATAVLSRKSVARAQMTDVAAAMGVSPGNLYNYVETKDVLLPLVLRRALDGELPDPGAVPIAAVPLRDTIAWLDRRLDWTSDFPVVEAAMARRRPADLAGEVGAVAVELYDVLVRVRPVVAILERSGGDIPELAAILQRVRGELFERMERYVERRRRSLRTLPDLEVAARLIIEATVYMALRRVADPKAPAAAEPAVRDSVRALAVHTLLPDKEVRR
jgi:AcrR family transcriptional regulator